MLTRTQEEILQRIQEVKERDPFGFERHDLIFYLKVENAQQFAKEPLDPEKWIDEPDPVEKIKDYMDFAWDKALGERGISSSRSVAHLCAWLWLAGEDELLEFAENEDNYPMYGKPILARVSEHYGLDIPEGWDEGDEE